MCLASCRFICCISWFAHGCLFRRPSHKYRARMVYARCFERLRAKCVFGTLCDKLLYTMLSLRVCGLCYLELYSLRAAAREEAAEMLFTGTLCGDASSAPTSLLSVDRVNQSFDAKSARALTQSWHDGSVCSGSQLSARPSFPISPICLM